LLHVHVRCLLRRLEIDYHEREARQHKPSEWFSNLLSDCTTLGLRYRIEGANFEKAGEASSKLKRSLRTLGISPDAARRIAIASYEAEMNMVIFTEGGELLACVEPGKVTVTAADHGPGIPDIERAMQPGYSTAPDWVRELGFGAGMGLPNIKNCSDELHLDSKAGEGTRVQFTVLT
jgi:anti-sigma regulatory factor (Ser/Thr protein kinase)